MIRDLPLVDYEHRLATACMEMEQRGILVDREYAEGYLSHRLMQDEFEAKEICLQAGIQNINSTAQCADVLEEHGAVLVKTTKSGKRSVDKEVLEGLIDTGNPEAARIAQAIKTGKQASGFKTKYVDKVLDSLDKDNRCHPSITALQARTARMSISDPPLHQLPSKDFLIRREFIAKPGHVLVAIDYKQIELRVLAALANDRRMLAAFAEGQDMHQVTADAAGVSRDVGKMVNFLIVYGGGAGKLAVSSGISLGKAKSTIAAYKRTFPGVSRITRKIIDEFHAGKKNVITPTGRVLPIDRHKVYGGLNYLIQSTARDVLGMAMVNLMEAGLWEYALLAIHDELLLEVPVEEWEVIAEAYAGIMAIEDFLGSGVDLLTDISGPYESWGHGYLKEGQAMPA